MDESTIRVIYMDRTNDGTAPQIHGTYQGCFDDTAANGNYQLGCDGEIDESRGPLRTDRQDWFRRNLNWYIAGGMLEQLIQGLRDQLLEAEEDAKRASRKIRRLQSQIKAFEQLQAMQTDSEIAQN